MTRLRLLTAASGAALLAGAMACAGAPATLQVDRQVAIDAPPAKIWSMIGRFGDLTWHPLVTDCGATQGNREGSVRTLVLGGATLVEQLAAYDAVHMTYTYRMLDMPANRRVLPVTGYVATISVRRGPNRTSVVDWRGSFQRTGRDDAAALHAVDGEYRSGLAGLKAAAEAD